MIDWPRLRDGVQTERAMMTPTAPLHLAPRQRMLSIALRRRLDIGWHVTHVLQCRVEQVARQEAFRVGQRLVLRPLPRRDHGQPARFEDFAEQILRHLGAKSVVQLIPDQAGFLVGLYAADVVPQRRDGTFLVGAEIHHRLGDGANNLLHRLGILLHEIGRAPDGAAGARDIVAGAQQHFQARLFGDGSVRDRQRGALDVVVGHGGDALRLALKRNDLVVLADVHVEETMQHRLRLVVIGAALAAIAENLAFEVLRRVALPARGDGPLRFERFTDDVHDLGAAQRRLRAARRNRRTVEIAGNNAGDLRPRVELDKAAVETFGFEKTLVERDVSRHVETVAPDHLADGDFGLLRVGADVNGKGLIQYSGAQEAKLYG